MGLDWAAAVVPLAALAATLLLTGRVRTWLLARALLDRPVARSSHREPTPRGGGLAVVPVLIAAWLALAGVGEAPAGTLIVLAAAAALAVVSWRDDVGGLTVPARLGAQAIAVLVGLLALPKSPVFQGVLPPLLDGAAAALLWLWFVNLFNFMDGIDGIAGVETAALGLGIALVLGLAGASGDGTVALALAAAAAGAGFLRWNWHPARIFLGDVGSVPLGYLLGWLLLGLAAKGLWAPALILPLYYLADASLTLALRLRRRAKVWQAHREHFYQRAIGGDGDHAAVALLVLAGDTVLVALAALAIVRPVAALVLALGNVAGLLALLARRAKDGG